jgi:hypothetical protein
MGLIPLFPSNTVFVTLLVGLCDLCKLVVSAKTSPESNIIGLRDLVLFTLVAIIYYLLMARGIHLVQYIIITYLLHPTQFINFNSN